MTVPAVLRAYAALHGFSVFEPEKDRFIDPVRRRVLRLASVECRRPTIVWLFDSDRGMVRFGQERTKCRPRDLPPRRS